MRIELSHEEILQAIVDYLANELCIETNTKDIVLYGVKDCGKISCTVPHKR